VVTTRVAGLPRPWLIGRDAVITCKEGPYPGAQLRFADIDGPVHRLASDASVADASGSDLPNLAMGQGDRP